MSINTENADVMSCESGSGSRIVSKKRRKRKDVSKSGVQTSSAEESGCMTKGAKVLASKTVIDTRFAEERHDKRINVNCRIETLGRLLGGFHGDKWQWFCDMGFEQLVHLYNIKIPRNLSYWLATQVDVEGKALVLGYGKVFRFSNVQVHWVLGIPKANEDGGLGLKIPTKPVGQQMKSRVQYLKDKYTGRTDSGTKALCRSKVLHAVESDDTEELEFKTAFILLALNDVLCPSTSHRMPYKLLTAATVARDARQYDWCSLVLDHLLKSVASFRKKFDAEGYVTGCRGCAIFLAVFYLDRLNRIPLDWNAHPRIQVWSTEELDKAEMEDELQSGDFGHLGALDIAYGKDHPLEAQDRMPRGNFIAALDKMLSESRIPVHAQSSYRWPTSGAQLLGIASTKNRRGATTKINSN